MKTMSEMRDRLIDLIISADISLFGSDKPYAEVYADCLIANGVIVPPCKIGDSVWINSKYRREKRPKYGRVTSMTFSDDMRLIIGVYRVGKGEWGKNVFGTEKEAEESMK